MLKGKVCKPIFEYMRPSVDLPENEELDDELEDDDLDDEVEDGAHPFPFLWFSPLDVSSPSRIDPAELQEVLRALLDIQVASLEQDLVDAAIARSMNEDAPTQPTAREIAARCIQPWVPTGEDPPPCAICMEDTADATLLCQHPFHRTCIQQWLEEYGHTCPVCRLDVEESIKKTRLDEEHPNGDDGDTGRGSDAGGDGADAPHDLGSPSRISARSATPDAPANDVPGDVGSPRESTPH